MELSSANWPSDKIVRQRSGGPGFSLRSRHTKDFKMVLDTSLLNTQQYKVVSRVKWSNPGKGVEPCSTPRCSNYSKGSLLVALDLRETTLLLLIYINDMDDNIVCVFFFSLIIYDLVNLTRFTKISHSSIWSSISDLVDFPVLLSLILRGRQIFFRNSLQQTFALV